jgi:D-alanyl-D-alanine carboxypeptidase/D-alanyl-D-alanine-endopeptidase (penicillin-binding protein 4)
MAARTRRRRLATVLPVALVLLLLGGGVASYQWDLGARWFGTRTPPRPDPTTQPAAVPPPPGVTIAAPVSPPAVAVARTAEEEGRLAPRRVARVLGPLLENADLGRNVVASVVDLSSGDEVFSTGGRARPASTTKLLTTAAVLHVLGPDHRFSTRVVLQGQGKQRRLVLVGGGDPYLASKPAAKDEPTYPHRADLRTLARKTAAAMKQQGVRRVRLAYDDSLFTGPTASPQWEKSYLPDGVVAPITALWADEGRPADGSGRVADPSLTAATYFAVDLRAAGLVVTGSPEHLAAREDAAPVADVLSPPLGEIVERVLTVSDNEAAEVLAHQVGVAAGEGSFAGGVAGVRQALTELGVRTQGDQWYDGSGLSRKNLLDPRILVDVLRAAASGDHPELRAVLSGLPVAGFTGSLEYRFADAAPPARGHVRAKTGTLRNTAALAGLVTDQDGTTAAFVLMADHVPYVKSLLAESDLDAAAAALAGCRCSVGSRP